MKDTFWDVAFYSSVYLDGRIWGCIENKNGLCVFDPRTGEAELIDTFDDEMICRERLFHYVSIIEDAIIFIPGNAKGIYIYDIETKDIKKTTYGIEEIERQNFAFSMCCSYKDKLLLLGCSLPVLLLYDVKKQIKLHFDLPSIIDFSKTGDYGFLADGYVVDGNKILLALECDNYLIEIDTEDGTVNAIKVTTDRTGFCGITKNNSGYWIDNCGKLMHLDNDKVCDFEIVVSPERRRQSFYRPLIVGKKVFLMPLFEKEAYVYDIEEKKVSSCEAVNRIIVSKNETRKSPFTTLNPTVIDNRICFFSGKDYSWCEYDVEKNYVSQKRITLKADSNYISRYCSDLEKYVSEKRVLEEGTVTISELIHTMCH